MHVVGAIWAALMVGCIFFFSDRGWGLLLAIPFAVFVYACLEMYWKERTWKKDEFLKDTESGSRSRMD